MTSEVSKQAGDMSLFGRELKELTLQEIFEQNDTESRAFRFVCDVYQWLGHLRPFRAMEKLEPIIESLENAKTKDPAAIYQHILKLQPLLIEIATAHVGVSMASGMGSTLMMFLLEKETSKWESSHYADVATMLSTCTDVFSADMPTMLNSIAESLAQNDETRRHFLAMNRRQAAEWLASRDKASKSHQLFVDFLAKHGHRCIRESELREKSWQQEPEKVVDALQTILRNETFHSANKRKQNLSVDEAIDAISTPISPFQQKILQYLLPMVRKAVGRREWSKSLTIKAFQFMRQAYADLAKVLTENGHLPDEDLAYFVSSREMGRLVYSRSSKTIAKAMRRRKLYQRFMDMKFEEITIGYAEPLKISADVDLSKLETSENCLILRGTPVGQGCISGIARVVTSLTDAKSIEAGDILVVPFTDVGWTPYFPLISGLVTELGGLISHGAVVAREFGLPCVVGCKQACRIVKTGDHVFIDGKTGQVRVSPSCK